jgi:hypothetical protein
VPIQTEVVNGSLLSWQDDIESLRPECSRCHNRGDTTLRRGRCLIADAEAFLADYIDRNGQLLLSRRVYAEAHALSLNRFVLRDVRRQWGIEARTFYVTGGRGCVAVWLVPDAAVPPPGRKTAGPP